MTDELKTLAKNLKISDLGIVRAEVFSDLCLDLHTKNPSEFVREAPEERADPFLIMEDAKSLIVCVFSYNNHEKGEISKYAMGKDYHQVVREKLLKLSRPLLDKGFKAEVFADSWSMCERYLAQKAGLGFVGKNHMFISEKAGSFVFIGVIVTDCDLKPTKPKNTMCIGCGECIKNCPGKALKTDGSFEEKNCVSYISQKKGELNEREKNALIKSGKIWGCDICQEVCPHNQNVPISEIEEFTKNLITSLEIDENMSNREFKRLYADRAFSWRGLAPILRNKKIFSLRK